MADARTNLTTCASGSNGTFGIAEGWASFTCPHCGGVQALRVGYTVDEITHWYRCATCLFGAVVNNGQVAPATLPLRTPSNLPASDAIIWAEARTCLGSGAYVGAVMLCRKLLLHIAVAHGLAPENANGRAPGFAECVKHLQATGVITTQMLAWVEPIKDIGNNATHEIEAISQDDATRVATFTLQLLVLAYELQMTSPESL